MTIIEIIPATAWHAPALTILHHEAFEKGWSAAEFQSLLGLPGTRAWLAVRADEPEGFVLFRTAADECEILAIAVRVAGRRRGTGRRLLDAVLGETAGRATRILLEVGEDNPDARAFYRALGFVEAGRRAGYYSRPGGRRADALILSRTPCG